MQASAVAYFTNGRVIVAPVSRTVSGETLAHDPRWFGKSAKKAVIAQALSDALSASATDLPDPTPEQWKRQFIPFQDAAAVKNFKTFMRDAKSVDIVRTGDAITLTPMTNLGPNNGFEAVEGETETRPVADMESVATLLFELLGLRPRSAATVADDGRE